MSHFNTIETFFVIPLNINDEKIQKINYLLVILEKSNIGEIIESSYKKSSLLGRKSYNPYKLFAAIVYCFAMHKGTLRNIEEMCAYDLRVQYIIGQEVPSFKTIHEFINTVIRPNKDVIFTRITKTIVNELNININDCYLDGTKIEANANKYKFVYKPRKIKTNLENKIDVLLKVMRKDLANINSKSLLETLKEYEALNDINIEASGNV